MNVSLTAELEALVNDKVRSGRYRSASEVVREALRLLVERDELLAIRKDAIRQQIAEGIAQADQGRLVDGDEALTQARARIDALRQGGE
jgi:antitoxin ParD1/3/4